MNPVVIFTDSCSDLPKDLREKYRIEYAKMSTVMDDKETPASLDWEYYSPKEFYGYMRKGKRITTSQVSEQEFIKAFTPWLEKGYDIVYLGCALTCSSSVNTGKVAAKKLNETFKNNKIFSVDALICSGGEGMVAIRAAMYRDQGLSAEEIVEKIMPERNKFNMFCTVHSLDALKRAGRVKASSAFFGNLLGVKPIIISDKDGNNTAIKKVKGRINSMEELAKLTAESMSESDEKMVLLTHADSDEDAEALKNMLLEKVPDAEIHICPIGPIIGASIGPDALCLFSFGPDVSRFKIG